MIRESDCRLAVYKGQLVCDISIQDADRHTSHSLCLIPPFPEPDRSQPHRTLVR